MALELLQPAVGSVSFTSYDLHAGHWLFAIKAVDGSGLESDFTEISLSLEQSGADLVEVAARPLAPTSMLAVAGAAGVIAISCEHDGTGTDPTHIRIYQDGVQIDDQAFAAGTSEYSHTTGALVDGQEYEFYAIARNGTTLSDQTETVTETADSSAPAVPTGLTAEAVF